MSEDEFSGESRPKSELEINREKFGNLCLIFDPTVDSNIKTAPSLTKALNELEAERPDLRQRLSEFANKHREIAAEINNTYDIMEKAPLAKQKNQLETDYVADFEEAYNFLLEHGVPIDIIRGGRI